MLLRKYMLLNKKRLIINQNVKLNSIIFFFIVLLFSQFYISRICDGELT